MQKITTCLWFNDNAEEAVKFYTSIFKNSKIGTIARYGDASAEVSGRPKDSVMTIEFELNGREFLALNGGPVYGFTPAISMIVYCETQEELDEMWARLTEGGEEVQCGWLTDKFGLSWQVVPTALEKMMRDKDHSKVNRVMAAILQMTKLDIATLKQAFEQ